MQVSGLTGVTAVDAGGFHVLAIMPDTTVRAWGYNYFGQLGDGTTVNRSVPVAVSGLSGVKEVAGGGYHSLARKSDGTVAAWGNGYQGQLGNGSNTQTVTTPVQVSGLSGVLDISASSTVAGGSYHSLAVTTDGSVWAWGYNSNGQLGNGTTTNSYVPTRVSGLTGVTEVAAGEASSFARQPDGTVWAWGWNLYGQLGDGTTTNRTTPVRVSLPDEPPPTTTTTAATTTTTTATTTTDLLDLPSDPLLAPYTRSDVSAASSSAEAAPQPAVSPSGCIQRAHHPHKSSHEPGRMNAEVRATCNTNVPLMSHEAQMWERRFWGWDRIGDKQPFQDDWVDEGSAYANDVCRNNNIRATGLGEIADIDGKTYYAKTESARIDNPCSLP